MKKRLRSLCAILAWLPILALAHNTLVSIHADEQNGRTGIRIELSAPPDTIPIHFSTVDPPRIVLDLPAADNATGDHGRKLDLRILSAYRIAHTEERSRLVFSLTQLAPYTVRTEGKTIVLDIASPWPTAVHQADRPRLQNIDFRRGAQAEGRIIIDLPGASTLLNVRRQGRQLIAEFRDTTLPQAMQRYLDVSDFGTPVHGIRSTQEGADVRMLIDAEGAWEHHAYQKDAQLVIEVRHENDIRTPPGYRGDKLSLYFQNVEVRAILHVIADFTGLNIITSDSISGVLSLRLKDVPWDQALDIVLQARGLGMRRNGNVMWIAPHDELLAKERLELEQHAQNMALEPMRAEVFQLNYQKAEAFRKMFSISDGSSPANGARHNNLLSRRGSAIVDQRTNQLFVTDTPTVLANIRKLLDKVDIAARQVLIEARIVEADDSFSRHLGVRLGLSARNNRVAVGNTYASLDEPTGPKSAAPATHADHHAINLPARAIGDATAGSIALSLFNAAANRVLDLELSALEADGKGRIVSSPRVVTADQQAALIEQGEEIPYQQATSSGATSTAFKKANLKLEVTPQITPDGNVILNVDINKDSRGIPTPGGLAINTKHVKTLVQVENGGTVVIGGIYTQTESLVVNKVPLLGDIPVLGNFFKNTSRIDNKTELLIFLTPRIVQDRPFPR
ncbi:MAG: type IV pilus secretin PilQ [Herbaspirillum sp.]